MRFKVALLVIFFNCSLNFAQLTGSLDSNHFVNVAEQSMAMFYHEYAESQKVNYDSVIAHFNYEDGQIVSFSDTVYCERLEKLNNLTPMDITCNEATLSTIKFFVARRRGFARVVIGRSKLYFDMYEAKLSEYDLPLELKYLSVIESGLRPQVKSRAGATGLWQFMYSTGKYMGLEGNSYIDERMDPLKATDAACRYLKKLYGIYNDWNLALAAYNAGPGNVNRAIRRSGGKKSYWEVRPYLPRETQGYVPNFIAAVYLLNYFAEHNIVPEEAPIHFAELDSMCFSEGVHFSTIEQLINWDEDLIAKLNPVYKVNYIPKTNPKQCLFGPLQTIGKLVSLEDSLYRLEDSLFNQSIDQINPENKEVANEEQQQVETTETASGTIVYHRVRPGESLGLIADKYNTYVSTIKRLNGLSTSRIYAGQRLKVPATNNSNSSNSKRYYTVRSGDTFGKIAQRYGKSVSQLRNLNPGINISRLSIGQRIRVR